MLNPRSFSEVFSDLLTEQPFSPESHEWESHLEPAWVSQVMADLGTNFKKFDSVNQLKHYTKPKPKITLQKAHVLNHEQLEAFQYLQTYLIYSMNPAFSFKELKSAFRVAVLKTHPDQGGSAETFHEIKKSYEILLSLVK